MRIFIQFKFQCTSKNEAGILGMLVHTWYIFDLLLNHEQLQADSLTYVVLPDRTTVLDLVALFRVHSYLNKTATRNGFNSIMSYCLLQCLSELFIPNKCLLFQSASRNHYLIKSYIYINLLFNICVYAFSQHFSL